MNGAHTHVDELLPGYALGALDLAEAAEVAHHLGGCERCRRIAAADRLAVEQLAFAAPRIALPPELRGRVMAAVAQEGAGPGPAAAPAPRRLARSRRLPRLLLLAAIIPWLLVIALGAGLMARQTPRPTMVVAHVVSASRRGIYGRLALNPDGTSAFLMMTGMPHLASGQAYVCWLLRNGRMERACAFRLIGTTDDATVVVRASHPLRDYTTIVVTREHSGAVTAPRGTILASGRV